MRNGNLTDKQCLELGATLSIPTEAGQVYVRRFNELKGFHAGFSIRNENFDRI